MHSLDRKLLRDLWAIRGQVLAIALVIAAGVAMFVMYRSNFQSLRLTQQEYYGGQRFGEVFASLKRAPESLLGRIAAIPGVAVAEGRVVAGVTLDVPGLPEPAAGRLVSLPDRGEPLLNDVYLLAGRMPEAGREEEVLASEGFALAHGLEPGDRLAAVLNGRRRQLRIVGLALSPEYIYTIRPGELMPDESRYGVFWMGRRALANAFDMEGGFNDVSLSLAAGASEPEVIARLDRLLEPYGGLGAIPRALQISHWYLESELAGLEGGGTIIPTVFLAVAAFLLNVVLSRIVTVQREQIAALKALGYSNAQIGLHYAKWSLTTVTLGSALGLGGGAWLGLGMARLYQDYFRFPELTYRLAPEVLAGAALVSVAAALLGAWSAVRRAVSLPPAEAMRPEAPASYRRSVAERFGLARWLPQAARMVLRNLERQPLRFSLSVVGIAFAGAMMVVGMFFLDAIEELLEVQFSLAQRQDVTLTFNEPVSAAALFELRRLPGVLDAEPMRAVAARLVHGQRERQVGVVGLPAEPRLNRVVDASYRPIDLPPEGLVLSRKLAEMLAVEPGETLTLEVLEGTRPVRRVPVVRVVEEYLGTAAYMEAEALRRLLREAGNLSGAYLAIDPRWEETLFDRLKVVPAVAAVALQQAAIESFRETIAKSMGLMIFFNVLFAGTIAFGVVYNAARVSLSERGRELASLRVMGFTRREVSSILLGELAVVTGVAIPVGCLLGYGLAALVVEVYDTELYRMPLVVSARTFAGSILTVAAAAVVSGVIVRRQLLRLDLVEALKTHE